MEIQRLCELQTIQEFFKIVPGEKIKEGTRLLLEAMEEVEFAKGEAIVTYGDSGDSGMFIILEGSTEVLDQKQVHINQLERGDFIGEVALINDDTRGATVVASSLVVCAHISKALFEEIAQSNRKIYATFMNMLYARTTKLVTEKERMKSELEIANRIQDSILEHNFEPFCKLPQVKITAFMKPAKAVGGDFYDIFMIDENRMCFLIADVSGKGVPGALFMTMAKTHIKNYATLGMPLAEVAYRTNNRLNENNKAQMFVTALLCVLDLRTNIVTFVNAGHNRPFISKQGTQFVMTKSKANLVLGMMEDMPYDEQTMELLPKDRLFLYTDGVTEAMNTQEDFLGDDGLMNALNRHSTITSVEEFVATIHKEIESFVDGAEQADDITMVYLARA